VVGAHGPVEPGRDVGSHRGVHVAVAIVMEHLGKVVAVALQVAKVRKEELPLAGETGDLSGQVGAHFGKAPLAEGDSIHRAGDQVDDSLHGLRGGQDAPNAPNRRDGRIVRMDGQPHSRLFGDRHHRLQKVAQIGPQRLFAHLPVFGERSALHDVVVVGRRQRSTAHARRQRRPQPAEYGHPVVADNGHARSAQVAQPHPPARDILVPAREPQFDPVRDGHALDDHPR